jgi:predicted RNA-binding Zn-ribbon protein involved in translation (DUF1610 family)
MEFNSKQLMNLFEKEGSITAAAKVYCDVNGLEYTDSIRRTASKVINKLKNPDHTPPKHSMKVLILDIETSPLRSYIWNVWNQNIGHNMAMMESDWFMLTWSAKWLYDEKMLSDKVTSEEVFNEDDSRICNSLWLLLEEADVVIAHNALKFDIKRINTRFLKNGLNPPMPYQVIDTLAHARRRFSISSNRLNYIAKFLGLGEKIDTGGFDLWKRCMMGDEDALRDMEVYNIQDVKLLEDVYLELLPYIKPHPNVALFVAEDVHVCPSCGSDDLNWEGTYTTYANRYDAFRCGDCGSIGRSRTAKPKGKNITIATPN